MTKMLRGKKKAPQVLSVFLAPPSTHFEWVVLTKSESVPGVVQLRPSNEHILLR